MKLDPRFSLREFGASRLERGRARQGNTWSIRFLTTEPNSIVAPIHPKAMPVFLLYEAARETWLNGTMDEALALQRPAPDGTLKIVGAGPKEDVV